MIRRSLLWTTSTEYASMDFETYCEAGYVRDPVTGKIRGVSKTKSGIAAVGTAVYAEHPSCEVISLAYDLKDNIGPRLWLSGCSMPDDLFHHITCGKIIQAWHSYFEFKIWKEVCTARMSWPILPLHQLRDVMARARAFGLPGKLSNAGTALQTSEQKMTEGAALIKKFCCPQPNGKRVNPQCDKKGPLFYQYNVQDIKTEAEIGRALPDLSDFEEQVFQLDQIINERGIQIDTRAVKNLILIVDQAVEKCNAKLRILTFGELQSISEGQKMINWLQARNIQVDDLQEETLDELIPQLPENTLPRQVLELRQLACSASIKKLYAIDRQASADGRLREQFTYCGADRTGRFSAGGAQLHNFPFDGIDLILCENGCGHYYTTSKEKCPWCGVASFINPLPIKWTAKAVPDILSIAETQSLEEFENYFGDAIPAIIGCLRGMLIATPGKELICSDFSAIEAVITAELAGETWRQAVFRTHGKIYEMSASKISGVPFEEFLRHKDQTGEHHPLRKKLGKVAELASGYKGWIGAWKKFGADKYFTNDEDLKRAILKWRADSPNIVRLWDNFELAFYTAVNSPSERYNVNGVLFGMIEDKLIIQLPSSRKLVYHNPQAARIENQWGRYDYWFSYMRWNKSKKKGKVNAWIRVNTWVGELIENIVQAIARDILCHSLINLEAAGYPIVLHVHDEATAEVPLGFGSIEEFERIGSILPPWCAGWPIKMRGGWRGPRFKKE